MLAGVDGAALRAFFKPSLGALLSLLPPSVFKLHHCRRAGEGSCDACDCCEFDENPTERMMIDRERGVKAAFCTRKRCEKAASDHAQRQ